MGNPALSSYNNSPEVSNAKSWHCGSYRIELVVGVKIAEPVFAHGPVQGKPRVLQSIGKLNRQ
jgi:hypothetical protein